MAIEQEISSVECFDKMNPAGIINRISGWLFNTRRALALVFFDYDLDQSCLRAEIPTLPPIPELGDQPPAQVGMPDNLTILWQNPRFKERQLSMYIEDSVKLGYRGED